MSLPTLLRLITLPLLLIFAAACAFPQQARAFSPDLSAERAQAALSKKVLLEEGRFAELLAWVDRHEPGNAYLKGLLNSRLTNTAAAVSNFLLCTNDRDLRDYAFYNIGLALSAANETNCLAWFGLAGRSPNPYIAYQSELRSAEFHLAVSNLRACLGHYLRSHEIIKDWERDQPSLLPFLGHSYLTRLLTSLTTVCRNLDDPRYREFGFRVLSMNQPNRYNPCLPAVIAVLTNDKPRSFDESFQLFRHLSGAGISPSKTSVYLEECLENAPSREALVQVLELGFSWWLPNNREKPAAALAQYAPRLLDSPLEDGVTYLRMLLAWSRKDRDSAMTNYRGVFSNRFRDAGYEAKTLSFYIDYMADLPADPPVLQVLLDRRKAFAADETIVSDLFQHGLSGYFRKADPAGTLALLTNLPSKPEHEYFIGRCLVLLGRRTEAIDRFRSVILSGSSEYYTALCLGEIRALYKTEKTVRAANLLKADGILGKISWKDGPLSAAGRQFLEILSLNPDFFAGEEMVDALIRSRPGITNGCGMTNDAAVRRLKRFFDSSLAEEGQVELLLNDRNDLPFCLIMTAYFNRTGYSYLQIKYAERVQRLLQSGFPAYRVRHPVVSFLYPEWYRKEVLTLSHRWNLAPSLVYAIMREESRFRYDALSRSGASGLMQLMPATFSEVMRKKADPETPEKITSPAANIFAGTAFLKDLLQRYGNEYQAVAAYNAGPSHVDRWLKRFNPPDDAYFLEFIPFAETKSYVRKVEVSRLGYAR